MNEQKNDQGAEHVQRLTEYIKPYIEKKKQWQPDLSHLDLKATLLKNLGGTEKDWTSWQWQMAHRLTTIDLIADLFNLTEVEKQEIESVTLHHRMALSPFLAAHLASMESPLAKQFLPSVLELKHFCDGEPDPMNEGHMSPVPHITRRYPDRVILKVTNVCGSYCRFCQRRRDHGSTDHHIPKKELEPAFEYIAQHEEIRDVLITGGDPLTLTNEHLEFIFEKLRQISHVELIRIGTRMPVVIPQRVDSGLTELIKKYAPIYINLHVNHYMEISPEMKSACHELLMSGAVLGSQSVLLRGINDSDDVLRYLFQSLLAIGIRPYYLFHAKDISGTAHFRTSVAKGVQHIKSLRGFTSGLAIPSYVVNMPGGLGKVPLLPQTYLSSLEDDPILFQTWENKTVSYPNKTLSSEVITDD
ncbi:L-lysine 2,3-aminomutase [Desulfitobacterium dehalogenans ATCC 51507]|uniref:L-lysine 2,3-aminomutase n=1 Tax=Desulfitobacterium dehalogenans (strain ATCC 51507 / DSM 9161 / JW/IU-DC1) TaxID=756499 RepID=I4A632_DESDJ|nr:KamA family radical SAM protein [Desulfitobacterium dehalogenans]AFL99416.1 L-lysine 2,3-aminomutase [Desulfitobacterium dehalogenans ATCC 51507]